MDSKMLTIENLNKIIDLLGENNVFINEPLSLHTSFKIGGPCDCLVTPSNYEQLSVLIKFLNEENIRFFVLGNGSNLLVLDSGIRGVVIKTSQLNKISVENDEISAESGAILATVSQVALENSLTGLEFASGIPGTIGGAVYMNAGAYDGEMSKIVIETEFLNSNGFIQKVASKAHEFDYRTSAFQKNGDIILKTKLKLKRGKFDEIEATMSELSIKRRTKQPLDKPSAGSTFKRPDGHFAGKLIMDAGLMGKRVGDAIVSDKHCGFVVNIGHATASDVISLIEVIKGEVFDKFGVELTPEIKIIGD